MYEELIIAGAGGQGALLLGEVLAIASVLDGRNATWLPSYGPEMRGGTANCSVVLSSEEIGSPQVEEPSVLVAFNQPSLDKFASCVGSEGIIFANSDIILNYPDTEAEYIKIPAATEAAGMGNEKALNMIMLGAIIKKRGICSYEKALAALKYIWGAKKAEKLLAMNGKAIQHGMDILSRED